MKQSKALVKPQYLPIYFQQQNFLTKFMLCFEF
jgi:hypothetical protein